MREFASGLPTPTDPPSTLESLRNDLQRAIETLIELGVLVHDYMDEPHSKEALDAKVRAFVDESRQTADMAQELQETQVPLDILNYIDNGRNPDIYSREFVELIQKQNQLLNGKTLAMRRFADILSSQLSEAFPALAPVLAQQVPKWPMPSGGSE